MFDLIEQIVACFPSKINRKVKKFNQYWILRGWFIWPICTEQKEKFSRKTTKYLVREKENRRKLKKLVRFL